jgi:hypothetical protein
MVKSCRDRQSQLMRPGRKETVAAVVVEVEAEAAVSAVVAAGAGAVVAAGVSVADVGIRKLVK